MGGVEEGMKLILSLLVLFVLYQIPSLRTPLKWIVGLIILGLLIRHYGAITGDVSKAFKGGNQNG